MAAEEIATKRELARRLSKRLKITQDSAERQVARWTTEPKSVTLDQSSRAALRMVLKAEPPSVGGEGPLEPRVAALETAVALIEQQLSEAGVPPRR